MKETLVAIAGPEGEGTRDLLAPAVCRVLVAPAPGTLLAPGARFAEVRVLRRLCDVVVPEDVHGAVAVVRATPPVFLAYGEPLVTVSQKAVAMEGAGDANPVPGGESGDIPDGLVAVRAETDGIFYRRPSPDEPPFVEEETPVDRGRTLGLVEVMKCFSQVRAPAAGRVARILAPDAGEVKLGQPLLLIEPSESG